MTVTDKQEMTNKIITLRTATCVSQSVRYDRIRWERRV